MKETAEVQLFVRAVNILKRKVVLDASVPKGVVEVKISPKDEVALKYMENTNTMLNQGLFLKTSNIHTRVLGTDATDRVISEASRRSWIGRWFYLKKMYHVTSLMLSDILSLFERNTHRDDCQH